MQDCGTIDRSAFAPKAAPLFTKLLSKLVLEVLPASLASVIGAALLAHYHFGHPSTASAGTVMVAPAPATPEMLQLVRDEHDLIRNFLSAQQAAQASRYAKAEARDGASAAAPSAKDAVDAELIAAALRRTANAAPAKALAPRMKVAVVAAAPQATAAVPAPAPAPAAAIAAAPLPAAAAPQQPNVAVGPQNGAAPAAPEQRSLMATILRVKDHVVSAPIHAVKAIGGIPSWIGHRLDGDGPDANERMFSAAS